MEIFLSTRFLLRFPSIVEHMWSSPPNSLVPIIRFVANGGCMWSLFNVRVSVRASLRMSILQSRKFRMIRQNFLQSTPYNWLTTWVISFATSWMMWSFNLKSPAIFDKWRSFSDDLETSRQRFGSAWYSVKITPDLCQPTVPGIMESSETTGMPRAWGIRQRAVSSKPGS